MNKKFNRLCQQMHKYHNTHFHVQSTNTSMFRSLYIILGDVTSTKHVENTDKLSD